MSSRPCLFDQVRKIAQQSPGDSALVQGDRHTSYLELDERARQVCTGLASLQLEPQSRLVILCRNRPAFFEIWHGASMAGHVLTPINPSLAAPEIAFIVNDSQAKVVFVDNSSHDSVQEIAAELPGVKQIFTLDSHPDWNSYHSWRDSQAPEEPPSSTRPDDTVVQMYTSGTTGFPKGVELDHGAVLACVRSMMGETVWPKGEVTLVTAPLFHTAGSAYAHCALQSGGAIVLLEQLSPETVLTAIRSHGVNQALLVPALIRRVLDSPDCMNTDFSGLRRILYGASPIPVSTLQQALEVFACDFEQGYGMTETVGPFCMLRPKDHSEGRKLASCGKAAPGTEIRVVDTEGKHCATNEVGEIIVSGTQLMKAYWNRPEATAEVIRDGWLHTGDAGYFDADGYLYIHDRLKDMIVTGGENVYPAEVEGVLTACEGVEDVAVIGVPDERWGESVKALVVRQAGSTIEAEDISTYARKHIAAFKCPKSIDFVDSIPRNPSGKILKKILREPYWKNLDRRVS
jgi:acyl-CoA synthetase (AMP-forming)/AMP-acid ligase II